MPIPDTPPAFRGSPSTTTPRSRRERNDVVDGAIGAIAWVAFLVVGSCSVFFSLLFGMATDACFTGTACNEDLVLPAMIVVWAGTTVAFLVASVGTTVGRALGRYSFYWPIVAIGITIIGLIIGLNIADAAGPQ